jgi:uncharacterized membrane protein HdeD (DUF308 family)
MNDKTTNVSTPKELKTWKLVLKLLGGITLSVIGIILSIFNPAVALAAVLWGIIWILQAFVNLIKKFKQSKTCHKIKEIVKILYQKIKEPVKWTLFVLLFFSITLAVFNFIAGLSATTIIIILLILILLK